MARGDINEYYDPRHERQMAQMLKDSREMLKQGHLGGIASVMTRLGRRKKEALDEEKRKTAGRSLSKALTAKPWRDPNTAITAEDIADVEGGTPMPAEIAPGQLPQGIERATGVLTDEVALHPDNPYMGRDLRNLLTQNFVRQNELMAEERKADRSLADKFAMHDYKKKHPLSASTRPSAPIQNYARREELLKQYPNLPDGSLHPMMKIFDNYVRASQIVDTGDQKYIVGTNPTQPTASYKVNLKPGETPEHHARVERAKKLAAYEIEKMKDLPSGIEAFDGKRDQEALLMQINRQVQDIVSRKTTGGTGGLIKSLFSETDQFELDQQIKTFEAAIGLDALIAAKAKGATFGALTKNEMDLLIATAGSLNTLRDPVEVGKAVQRALNMFSNAQRRSEKAFYAKYGKGAHRPIKFVRSDADMAGIQIGEEFYDPNGQRRRRQK